MTLLTAGNGVVTAALRGAIADHRDTFVTEADMVALALNGVNAIRIPIGDWLLDTMQARHALPWQNARRNRVV